MKVSFKELKNLLFKKGEKDKTNKVIGQAVFSFIFKFKNGKKSLLIFWKVAITTIILNAIVIILLVKLLS